MPGVEQGGRLATFAAGSGDSGTSELQLLASGSTIELRNEENAPSIHAVRGKQLVFHERTVPRAEGTALSKALRDTRVQTTVPQPFGARRARTSDAPCQACLAT